jgi:hypothetical protein
MNAHEVNTRYLESMTKATAEKEPVLFRVARLWWPHFIKDYETYGLVTLDRLDVYMNESRTQLRTMAEDFASGQLSNRDSDQYRQKVNQFLKSNTGKMFERFIGLSISYALLSNGSKYSIWPFRSDLNSVCPYLHKDNFQIKCKLGEKEYSTAIDCDLIVFPPENPDSTYYMLSIKSTLKDRFHNVPFWNLLRLCAINQTHNLNAENAAVLSKAKYVAACTDLAEEQPDFSNESGPRNLLCLDAAILDGAYVTSSKAKGLGGDDNHFGESRTNAFYPLSKFLSMLCA